MIKGHSQSDLSEKNTALARDQLHKLERTHQLVFHGSPLPHLKTLEPRQSYTIRGGKHTLDGEPAVACTEFADIAIFRALTNIRLVNQSSRSSFGVQGKTIQFYINESLFNFVHETDRIGYVYVISKENVWQYNAFEYRSSVSIPVENAIEVGISDFPSGVQIMPDNWASFKQHRKTISQS